MSVLTGWMGKPRGRSKEVRIGIPSALSYPRLREWSRDHESSERPTSVENDDETRTRFPKKNAYRRLESG